MTRALSGFSQGKPKPPAVIAKACRRLGKKDALTGPCNCWCPARQLDGLPRKCAVGRVHASQPRAAQSCRANAVLAQAPLAALQGRHRSRWCTSGVTAQSPRRGCRHSYGCYGATDGSDLFTVEK